MSTTKALGDRGEAVTAQYLRERGYALLASQWRCRYGELDLVARDRDGTICFVEVKLRGGDLAGLPREAVDRRKRERTWRRSTPMSATSPSGWNIWRTRLQSESTA